VLTLQFRFGQFDQPGEALAMFCSEILSFEKSPAMLDYSALALNQEGSDTSGHMSCTSRMKDPGSTSRKHASAHLALDW
jgi:hypothetical protein